MRYKNFKNQFGQLQLQSFPCPYLSSSNDDSIFLYYTHIIKPFIYTYTQLYSFLFNRNDILLYINFINCFSYSSGSSFMRIYTNFTSFSKPYLIKQYRYIMANRTSLYHMRVYSLTMCNIQLLNICFLFLFYCFPLEVPFTQICQVCIIYSYSDMKN